MKPISKLVLFLFVISTLSSCKLFQGKDPEPVDTTPIYQKAIDAKFASLGWAATGHTKFNNSSPVPTAGGKGWVQYYAFGDRKKAIYYSEKGAFAVDTEEMKAYDAAGQDNFGTVVSDPKPTKIGACGYNDIITNDGKEAIITCQAIIKGDFYANYKEMGRWDSPLGLPNGNEKSTPSINPTYAKGSFQEFQFGAIFYFPATGAKALWGKTLSMYGAQDWERGWLKLPLESCDPKKPDNKQYVKFQGGIVDSGDCGKYYESEFDLRVFQNGKFDLIKFPPCY